MNGIDQQLDYARDLCQRGSIEEGKAIYLDIYARDPKNFRVLANLGAIELNTKNYQASISYFKQAIALNSNQPIIFYNMGRGLHEIRKYDEAVLAYRNAINLNPNFVEAYLNFGLTLISQENYSLALENFHKVVDELDANNSEAYNNMGVVFNQLDRYKDAISNFDKSIKLKPDYAQPYSNKALSLLNLGMYDDAVHQFQRAIQLGHDDSQLQNNLGLTFYKLRQYPDAIASYDKAILSDPSFAEAFSNRGLVYHDIGQYEKALDDYKNAIKFNPALANTFNNYGLTLYRLGQYQEALQNFEKAIDLLPKDPLGYWNKSLVKLLLGEYEEGWKLYERRWERVEFEEKRYSNLPLWSGSEDLRNKRLLIWSEQGQGDIIQFSRYALLAKERGANITLEVPQSLVLVLSQIDPEISVIAEGSSISEVDLQIPIMSMPLAFQTTIDNIPSKTSYIHPNAFKTNKWKEKLGGKNRLRVGLTWSGSSIHKNDLNRSVPLEKILPICELPIEIHSLQVQYKENELNLLNSTSEIIQHQHELEDFSDTAALIENMDLIISVDTSVAHLGAAMGKNTWILLPYSPDFRWMLDRSDSPWYPTARLFRQPMLGDWEAVISEIRNVLSQ